MGYINSLIRRSVNIFSPYKINERNDFTKKFKQNHVIM